MQFPVLLCKNGTLVVVRRDFFDHVGRLDEASGKLELSVTPDGRAGLQWILDCEGTFFRLTSQGFAPANLLQKMAILRRRERFQIEPATTIKANQLSELIAKLYDASPDFPNVSDLQKLLANLPAEQVLTRENLRAYFGE